MPEPRQSSPADHSLPEAPRLPARVFINYASDDREIAEWLHDRLIDAGALSVWMDRSEIRGGDRWKKKIDSGLWRSQIVVAVLTGNSVDPGRTWVHYEQERAITLLHTIIPCLFEPEKKFHEDGLLPQRLRPLDVIPFHEDREKGLRRLLNSIGQRIPRYGEEFQNQARGIRHSFVGREQDLREIKTLIDSETREQATGRKLIARGVLQRWMARHLKEPPRREYEPADVRALLGTYYGEMLFLFDDVSPRDFAQTKELLEAVPPDATRILTTRSEDVCIGLGAVIYPLKKLEDQDAKELLRTRLRERFASGPDAPSPEEFERTLAENESALMMLIEKVEGHPLALDLGIGSFEYLDGIEETVTRLTESLERGVQDFELDLAMDAAERNHSLAHSLAVSLRDLQYHDERRETDWERRFRALGIFPDGSKIQRDLIATVWGDDDSRAKQPQDALRGLRRRAMLRIERSSGLYYNHPVVRAYATGLLAGREEQAGAARGRYWRWVIERASEGFAKPQEEWIKLWPLVPHIRRVAYSIIDTVATKGLSIDQAARPEALEQSELDELRSVGADTVDLGLKLANSLREFVIRRPEQLGEEGLRVLRLGLASARAGGFQAEKIEFLKRLGGALARRDPDRARRYLTRGLELARETRDRKQEAAILSYSGELERTQGNSREALDRLSGALDLHRASGDRRLQASTLKYMGEVFWRMGRHAEAAGAYDKARELYEAVGSNSGKADILNKLGSVEFNSGRHRKAIELFQQALELHRTVGNRSMEAEDLNDMGAAYRYLKEPHIAMGHFEQALGIHVQLGNRRLESITRCNLGGTLCDVGQFEEGRSESVKAKALAQEVNAPIPLLWSHCWEAKALRGLGDRQPAERSLREALELVRQVENPRGLAGVLCMLGDLLSEQKGRDAEAVELLRDALEVMQAANLDQAFGGYKRDEVEKLLDEVRERPGHA